MHQLSSLILLFKFRLCFAGLNVSVRAKSEKMMWQALREAIDEEMERDPKVLVIGHSNLTLSHLPLYRRRRRSLWRQL